MIFRMNTSIYNRFSIAMSSKQIVDGFTLFEEMHTSNMISMKSLLTAYHNATPHHGYVVGAAIV